MPKKQKKTIDDILKKLQLNNADISHKPIPASLWITGNTLNGHYHMENNLIIEQVAYDCSTCGAVEGKPKRTPNQRLSQSQNPGVDIDCYKCKTHLGEVQYVDE